MMDDLLEALRSLGGGLVAVEAGGAVRLSSLADGVPVTGSGDEVERLSPATGTPVYAYRDLSIAEADDVIAGARAAYSRDGWRNPATRSRALRDAADAIEEQSDLLARVIVAETGKPIREARGEVGAVVNGFNYFSGLARDVTGRTHPNLDPHRFAMTVKEPAGLAALVVPWNFPVAVLTQKLAPALAAGCGVVIKPSPLAALSPLLLAAIIQGAGVPRGLVNVVLGGPDVGQALVEHEDIDVVSFTGSTAVGRAIAATAGAKRLKKLAIEAGGNAAVIVLDDADVEQAARGVIFGSLFNQGECCVATGRVLVHDAAADAFVDALRRRMARVRLGDPYDESTELGPLITADHCAAVLEQVEGAVGRGASVVTGGRPLERPDLPGGPYLEPTLLIDAEQSSELVQEEIFAPVATVQRFATEAEAISLANDTKYGLGASVWTSSLKRALTFSQAVRAGNVWVNGAVESFPELPISGRRDSGFSPEFGREGIEFFSEVRTIQLIGDPSEVGLDYGG